MKETEDDKGEDMNSGLGIAERERLLHGLRMLPDTPPPREVWQRIERQARAEGLLRRASIVPRTRWLAGAAVAATVALAALRFAPFGGEAADQGPFPTEPAYAESARRGNLAALMVHSQLLEQDLRALPAEPRVMRAATAATISDLQDRIAAIDYALNDPQADLSRQDVETYWRERVRLMDSLLQVRYAQARLVSF